jgi:TonB family protein
MKRFGVLTAVVLAAISVHAASYESRTLDHAIAVEIVSITGDDVVYGVTLTELPSGKVLTSPRLTGKVGGSAESQADIGEQHVRIRITLSGTNLSCSLRIEKGDVIVDKMETVWSTQAQRISVGQDNGRAAEPFHVGGDVQAPVVLKHVNPQYPELARREKVSGLVVMEVVIDRTGALKDIRVIQPLPDGLSESAVDAVKQWTFAPGTLNGKPVDVLFNLTINFKL